MRGAIKRKRTAYLFANRILLHSQLSKNQLFNEAHCGFRKSWFPLYLPETGTVYRAEPCDVEGKVTFGAVEKPSAAADFFTIGVSAAKGGVGVVGE